MGIFYQAFDYFEVRLSADNANEVFNNCCLTKDGKRYLTKIPFGVASYCDDYLAGKCRPISPQKLLGKKPPDKPKRLPGDEWKDN
jgi:hypothetical protein